MSETVDQSSADERALDVATAQSTSRQGPIEPETGHTRQGRERARQGRELTAQTMVLILYKIGKDMARLI